MKKMFALVAFAALSTSAFASDVKYDPKSSPAAIAVNEQVRREIAIEVAFGGGDVAVEKLRGDARGLLFERVVRRAFLPRRAGVRPGTWKAAGHGQTLRRALLEMESSWTL